VAHLSPFEISEIEERNKKLEKEGKKEPPWKREGK